MYNPTYNIVRDIIGIPLQIYYPELSIRKQAAKFYRSLSFKCNYSKVKIIKLIVESWEGEIERTADSAQLRRRAEPQITEP